MPLALHDIEPGAVVREVFAVEKNGSPGKYLLNQRLGVIVRVTTRDWETKEIKERTTEDNAHQIFVDFQDGKPPVIVPNAALALHRKADHAAMEALKERDGMLKVVGDARSAKPNPSLDLTKISGNHPLNQKVV